MNYDYMLDEPDYRDQEEMLEALADREFLEAMIDFDLDGEYYDPDEVSANACSDWENDRDQEY